ncbi:uncharacterized protein LOC114517695 [Dendronephthya gigantea]|uniref:uncharacterized protein LOC114517695 n=1 Tax=Dendronephthya gigantea TaxID=151771 RepID=UPI00106CFF86|nr:uncharacterized protein LOC114517695 [Dendronephthya gigantea]
MGRQEISKYWYSNLMQFRNNEAQFTISLATHTRDSKASQSTNIFINHGCLEINELEKFATEMGKIRRVRTKRHIEAVKGNPSEDDQKTTNFLPNESHLPALFPTNNLFEIEVPQKTTKDEAHKNCQESGDLADEEKLSTKKGKRKLRHQKFLKKLHASKAFDENYKATKIRQKTVITGDLNPLTEALLDIDKMPTEKITKKKRKNTKKQNKSSSSEQKRLNAQIADMERFQKVVDHPLFKSKPLLTIDEHVKNVIKNQT